MKSLRILLFFIFYNLTIVFGANLTPSSIWNSNYVDTALTYLKMTRNDVSFQINYKVDLELPIVKEYFAHPNQMFDLPDQFLIDVSNIEHNYSHISDVLEEVSDLDKYRYVYSGDFIADLKRISEWHYLLYQKAFEGLPDNEKETLLDFWISLFTGAEDDETNNESDLLSMKKAEHKYYENLLELRRITKKVNFQFILRANVVANSFYFYWLNHQEELKKIKSQYLNTEYGIISINQPDSIYDGNYLCIVDSIGNDSYKLSTIKKYSCRFIFDLSGNDVYAGNFAGGQIGSDFIYDGDGDDYYNGENISEGSAFLGTGLLLDMGGDDVYIGKNCVQGSGSFGIGILLDNNGNDVYKAYNYCQGYGYTMGIGILQDNIGNDSYLIKNNNTDILRYDAHYTTFGQGQGMGVRPFFGGGIGMLQDLKGNDTYSVDNFGEGCAYWFSVGILADRKGNDYYNGYQYVQGSGVHLAFGALLDYYGEDFYSSNSVSQGCGHDYAVGCLIDLQGDDFYTVEGLALGGGNADAISIFIDANGNDAYSTKRNDVYGYSDFRRGFGYIGLFLDLNGKDKFPQNYDENVVYLHSTYGIKWSADHDELDEIVPSQPDMEPSNDSLSSDIQMLFYQASAASAKYYHLINPARERLLELGDSALPVIMQNFSTYSPREKQLLYYLLPRMGEVAHDSLISILNSEYRDKRDKLFAFSLLSICDNPADSVLFLAKLSDEKPEYRLIAVKALGNLKIKSSADSLEYHLLFDKNFNVRRECARTLGMLGLPRSFFSLFIALDQPYQYIRYTALNSIKKLKYPQKQIINALQSFPYPARYYLVDLLDSNLISNVDKKSIMEKGDFFINYFLKKKLNN